MSGAEALLSPLANAVGVPPYLRRRIICVRSRRPLPEELMDHPCVKTISPVGLTAVVALGSQISVGTVFA